MNLSRFIRAQDTEGAYERAMDELRCGRKTSHWIWYIFPQISGLGHSSTSRYFSIGSLLEAKLYIANPVLSMRLKNAAYILLSLPDEYSAESVLGRDAVKLKSSMTLFDMVCPDDVFSKVLDRFFNGSRCEHTLEIVADELIEG